MRYNMDRTIIRPTLTRARERHTTITLSVYIQAMIAANVSLVFIIIMYLRRRRRRRRRCRYWNPSCRYTFAWMEIDFSPTHSPRDNKQSKSQYIYYYLTCIYSVYTHTYISIYTVSTIYTRTLLYIIQYTHRVRVCVCSMCVQEYNVTIF